MSVVARQGIKYSIIGYLSFLVGAVSSFLVFPYDMEFYGKLRYILPAAEMILPLVVFGLSYANVKYYHQSQKDGKHQNILSLSLLFVTLNFGLFLVLYFTVNYLFPQIRQDKMFKQLWQMKMLVLPLVLVLAISQVFNKYISNYKRIVVPNIFENLFPKIATLGSFILFFFIKIPEKGAFYFFFMVFFIGMLGYYIYANKLEKLHPDFSTQYVRQDHLWKGILTYGFFGFLGNIGSYLSLRIDNYMIPGYLGYEANGIYSTIISIITLINIPQMGMYNISAPMINKHLAENTMAELNDFHQKTSLSIYFTGLILFSCILVGYPYLTHIIKNGDLLAEQEPVVWIMGIGILFDLATGFNGHIISLSKYFKFNIVIMLILAILNIGLNLYFFTYTELRLIGVAIATAVSLILYNIIKIVFNYYKFKVSPFSLEMLIATVLCSLITTIAIMLPPVQNIWINLIYKPAVVLILVFIANLYLNIIPVKKYLNKTFLGSILRF